MNCPICNQSDTKVLDSRTNSSGNAVRRRRECNGCGHRFTTYERAEQPVMYIIKKDGRREKFNRDKLARGIAKACEKRPISANSIETIVEEIEDGISNMIKREIKSELLGRFILDKLKKLDPVAYLRFASVYLDFKDVNSFKEEVEALLESGEDE